MTENQRVSSYPQLLAMPGSAPFIAKPVIVLAVYFGVVLWMTSGSGDRAAALSVGTSFGPVTAGVQIIRLFIESFGPTEELMTGITALAFMIGTFLLCAVAGYVTGRRGASVGAGSNSRQLGGDSGHADSRRRWIVGAITGAIGGLVGKPR
jgi:hypothetical protein